MAKLAMMADVPLVEINGEDREMGDERSLIVRSHPIYNGTLGLVVIEVFGKEFAVSAQALEQAISRCRGLP